MTRLVVRADANSSIGFGHVMRCLALTNGSENYTIHWYSTDAIAPTLKMESIHPIAFHRIENEEAFHQQLNSEDVVIIDGYAFTPTDYEAIHSSGAFTVVIDDLADKSICADLLINPTPNFPADSYQTNVNTVFLTGINYALLRKPFLALAQKETLHKKAESVLICFGGSDPLNHTSMALELAVQDSFSEIHVVIGAGYRFLTSLAHFSDPRIHVHQNLDADQMAKYMEQCEWGIYPCSGILLEGLAAQQRIIGGITADNQAFVYAAHKSLGTIIDANDFSVEALRNALEKRSSLQHTKRWIDGRSIERIHQMIRRLTQSKHYVMRTASPEDVELTFTWAKEPDVRRFAFQQHEIKEEEHRNWFLSKIADVNCHYYLMEIADEAVGSIRFDLNDNDAVISYLLAPRYQGIGLGLIILRKGMDRLLSELPVGSLHQFVGEVMSQNHGSIRIFEQLGFHKEVTERGVRFTKTIH